MTPEGLAALHERAMHVPAPWTTADFAAMLRSPGVFVVGDNRGFALGRVVADEAELLTLAVDPPYQRRGFGRQRLAAFEAAARKGGARTCFLEVAADNAAAIALYTGQAYRRTGFRPGYYRRTDGTRCDAMVMARSLPD